MRVLCVEDDQTTAKNVELMCHMAGHTCDTIGLGEQAIELGKTNEYDIIVLDIMLPDIDGYQVIGRLRAAGVHTPFLIQSGLVDRDNELGADPFGDNEYLVKPFTRNELIDRMQAVISGLADESMAFPENDPDGKAAPRPDGAERRQHRRFATLKTGEITCKSGIDPISCIVLNLSYGGAEVRLLDEDFDCPSEFALKFQAGPIHNCEVRWKREDRIGVKFI
jgi:DNA-binding response OmpR family regulator